MLWAECLMAFKNFWALFLSRKEGRGEGGERGKRRGPDLGQRGAKCTVLTLLSSKEALLWHVPSSSFPEKADTPEQTAGKFLLHCEVYG